MKKGKLILFGDVKKNLLTIGKDQTEFGKIRAFYNNDLKSVRAKFGWLGEDYTPNKVADNVDNAISKQEDYFPFPFRHLTATIVGGGSWKATEFSDKVLKAAAKMLTHKPVYVNHTLETGNIVGVNGTIRYVPAKNGVPGGLEGPIWVDGKLHPDITRKLTAFPVPHIQSVSVTVSYEWEPSHVIENEVGDEDEWLFERRIGTMVDGTMVRRKVTKITDFHETSFVWLGADPYAKILDASGNPLNIERSAVVDKKHFDQDPFVDQYKDGGLILIGDDSLSNENITKLKQQANSKFAKSGNFEQKKDIKMNAELLAALAKMLNKSEEDITPEMLEGFVVVTKDEKTVFDKAVKDAKENGDKVTKLEGEKTELETSNKEFAKIMESDKLEEFAKTIPLDSVAEMATFGNEVLIAKRAACEKAYKLSQGDKKPNDAILETIRTCKTDVLNGMLEQYGESAIEEYGGTCSKCGTGDHITYKSTAAEGAEGAEEKPERESMSNRKRFR